MMENDWLAPSMPAAETELLTKAYQSADVILEYGSGSSTAIASAMRNKLIYSVESDVDWALRLQQELYRRKLPSPAIVYHVNVGETGKWGRPKDTSQWHLFSRYATAIWTEPFFRDPDVVLIDGRLRLGCLAAVAMGIRKKTTVLFDDYVSRPLYMRRNELVKPDEVIGRMARFTLEPGMVNPENFTNVVDMFSMMSLVGKSGPKYYG